MEDRLCSAYRGLETERVQIDVQARVESRTVFDSQQSHPVSHLMLPCSPARAHHKPMPVPLISHARKAPESAQYVVNTVRQSGFISAFSSLQPLCFDSSC